MEYVMSIGKIKPDFGVKTTLNRLSCVRIVMKTSTGHHRKLLVMDINMGKKHLSQH